MKRGFLSLLIVVAIVIAMVMTCPGEDAHKEKVSERVTAKMLEEANLQGNVMGAMLGTAILSPVIGALVEVDDYFLFSLGKISLNGETQIVSLGLFNHVFFIGDYQDVAENIERRSQELLKKVRE